MQNRINVHEYLTKQLKSKMNLGQFKLTKVDNYFLLSAIMFRFYNFEWSYRIRDRDKCKFDELYKETIGKYKRLSFVVYAEFYVKIETYYS